MNTAPRIGITCWNIDNGNDAGCGRAYVESILKNGGVPFLLTPQSMKERADSFVKELDGILFTGGEDVEPQLFGETRHSSVIDCDPERDAGELALFKAAELSGLPILAICRGLQIMNVYRGGTLYQDIPSQIPAAHKHQLRVNATEEGTHEIFVAQNTKLEKSLFCGTDQSLTLLATSTHHQSVKKLGKNLLSNAFASDGIVEGIEDPSLPFFLGVQCHPERLWQGKEPKWRSLFQSFLRYTDEYSLHA